MRSRAAQLATLQQAFNDDGARFRRTTWKCWCRPSPAIWPTDAMRGWLFTRQRDRQAPGLRGHPARLHRPRPTTKPARCCIELKANAKGTLATTTIRISAADIVGKTVSGDLRRQGLPEGERRTDRRLRRHRRALFRLARPVTARSSPARAPASTPKTRPPPTATPTGRARTWWCCPPAAAAPGW